MVTRRRFIRNSGFSILAAALLDPFLKSLAQMGAQNGVDLTKLISHICEIQRSDDLLIFKYYFINLAPMGDKLVKRDRKTDAFIIVRTRQLHIAEELKGDGKSGPWTLDNDCEIILPADNNDKFSKSFIAGFSYQVFRIPKEENYLRYTAANLLDWNQFDLITIDHLITYPTGIPVSLNGLTGDYPISLKNLPSPLLISQSAIPITLYETPYKMYLSPIAPHIRPSEYTDYKYGFLKNNKSIQRLKKTAFKREYLLYELWSNSLVYQGFNKEKGITNFPPHFKILAYEEQSNDGVPLLPEPLENHRSKLAYLTNAEGEQRDVEAEYFHLTSLGATTFLNYYNLQPVVNGRNYYIVKWKQDIVLGRDNYVEITERGVDIRSGLKVLVSIIAERRVEKGISFLMKRYYFKYLECEKDYSDGLMFNNMVIKKIMHLDEGSFFRKHPLITVGSVDRSFIVVNECGGTYPDGLLKMRYKGYDANGNELYFTMDVSIIMEDGFEIHINDTITNLNTNITQNADHHAVRFDKIKIAYCKEPEENLENPAEKQKNSELVTEEIQLYSVYKGALFSESIPVLPRLKYSRVYIPQLEGIETDPTTYFVAYATRYAKDGFKTETNKAKIFLQLLSSKIKTEPVLKPFETISERLETTGAITQINEFFQPISDIFSKYYKNAGSLVNPGIRIDNLAALPQNLMMSEQVNELENTISHFNPETLLRGLDREILGGINLVKILKKIISLKDAPVFNYLEDASGKIGQLDALLQSWKDKIANGIPAEIAELERKLKSVANDGLGEVARYAEAYLQKTNELRRVLGFYTNLNSDRYQNYVKSIRQKFWVNEKMFTANAFSKIKDLAEFADFRAVHDFFEESSQKIRMYISMHQLLDKISTITESSLLYDLTAIQKQYILQNFAEDFREKIFSSYQKIQTIHEKINLEKYRHSGEKIRIILLNSAKQHLFDFINSDIALPSDYLNIVVYTGKTLRDILIEKDIILASASYKIKDDLSSWARFLSTYETELKASAETAYKILIDGFNEIHKNTEAFIDKEKEKIRAELGVLQQQISNTLRRQLDTYFKDITTNEAYTAIQEAYKNALDVYGEFKNLEKEAQRYKIAAGIDLVAWPPDGYNKLSAIEAELKLKLNTELEQWKAVLSDESLRLDELVRELSSVSLQEIEKYQSIFITTQAAINRKKDEIEKRIFGESKTILNQIDAKRKELELLKRQVENRVVNFYKEKGEQLKKANEELINAYKLGTEAVENAKRALEIVKSEWEQLRGLNKKEINYTWETTEFDDTDLGILKFIVDKKTPTRLQVAVNNTIHFDLQSLPPKISSVDFNTHSQISNFSVTFLGILTLDFDRVVFKGGNHRKEEFDVVIKNVRFSGPLNFIEVFQSYLKTLDKNLRFDISAEGAMLGYELPLPNITGGAFNFTKAKLALDLRLPFKAGVPMRFTFGLNTPQELFLVSCGIFGGRGCFMIGVEPKRGVVLIILIIEFGGVLYLALGPAEGIAYLFAGIYFRKEYNQVEIRGYIICGGSLSLLSLITASVVFSMGLKGNGKYMDGYCTVEVEIKICAFFKIELSLTMYKRLYGTTDNSQRSEAALEGFGKLLANDNEDLNPDVEIKEETWNEYFESYYR